jgi:hypothetical protein
MRMPEDVAMGIDRASTVRLHGHPGLLRVTAPVPGSGASARAIADDAGPRWVWEGAVDGPGLVAILRSVMVHGVVPTDVDGRPHRARALGCWYDAAHGTALVELAGPPEPLA